MKFDISKKNIIIIVMMLIIIVGIILIFNRYNITYVTGSDAEMFSNEYESLNNQMTDDNKEYPKVEISSNNMEYVTIEKVLDILGNGNAVIYIGYAECLYCRSAVQVLVDTAKNKKLDAIYYLDISDIWDIKEIDDSGKVITTQEANSNYNKLLKELCEECVGEYILEDNNGKEIKTGTKRVNAPLVLFVVNGDIVSYNVGTVFSQDDPYTPLDEYQVSGLSEIYSYGIRDVIEGIKANKQNDLVTEDNS